MPAPIGPVLILLALLQVKHMFADYYLQTPRMLAGRCRYLHAGRAQHAGVHAGFTALVLAVMGTPWTWIAALCLAEWAVHFHIDWGKARWSEAKGHTPQEAGFWRAAGFDQFLHQASYLALAWAWVAWV